MDVSVNEFLTDNTETVTNDNEESIWVKIKNKNLKGEKENISISTFTLISNNSVTNARNASSL